ncbi:MAG: hypothetical protein IT184_07035 [Acidobacteria bacterium]|nr:hypothetical protein [Acidobacteriota bacterium]
MPLVWLYPPELLEAVRNLGFDPRPETPPVFVRSAVNDLYRYELRRLRDRHKAGQIARGPFLDAVIALRKKYWVLTLQTPAWERICGAG